MRNRRIAVLTAGASILALAGCGSDGSGTDTPLGEQQLVYVNYGGEMTAAADKAWLQPFSKETGVSITQDAPVELAKIKAQADAGQVTWDVVTLDPAAGSGACGTLFEKRDPDIDMSPYDPDLVADDCMLPLYPQAVNLVYNKKIYGDNPPTKITDFMDTQRFPGKRIAFNLASTTLPALLLATGVPADEMYPLDFSRAAKAIDDLGSDFALHADLAAEVEKLTSGDFAMCLCFLGRVEQAVRSTDDIGIVWDGTVRIWTGLYAVKGSRSPQAQQELFRWFSDPERYAPFYDLMAYDTPFANPGVPLPDKFAPYLASAHQDEINESVVYDVKWMRENYDQVLLEWTEMTAG